MTAKEIVGHSEWAKKLESIGFAVGVTQPQQSDIDMDYHVTMAVITPDNQLYLQNSRIDSLLFRQSINMPTPEAFAVVHTDALCQAIAQRLSSPLKAMLE
jgi:hypothetical protein